MLILSLIPEMLLIVQIKGRLLRPRLKMQRVNQKQLDFEVLPEEARKELIDRRMKGKGNGKIDAIHEFH